MTRTARTFLFPVVIAGLLCLALAASLPGPLGAHFHEGGAVETLSAVLLAVAALALPFRLPRAFHLSVILALLAEREFDGALLAPGNPLRLAQEWTEAHLLHNRVFVIALALWLLWALARNSGPRYWNALRAGRPEPAVLAVAVGFAVLGQIAGEGAKHFGHLLSETAHLRFMIVEEMAELYFSVGIIAALLVGWPQRQTAGHADESPDKTAHGPR